jgi:uncharacterized membrane protein
MTTEARPRRHLRFLAEHQRLSAPFGPDVFGRRAEAFARLFGTPAFLIAQTLVVAAWIAVNAVALGLRWDPYPFILLNLAFSTQAAYAAPLILLAQTRQADRDRARAEADARHREAIAEAGLERQGLTDRHVARLESLLEEHLALARRAVGAGGGCAEAAPRTRERTDVPPAPGEQPGWRSDDRDEEATMANHGHGSATARPGVRAPLDPADGGEPPTRCEWCGAEFPGRRGGRMAPATRTRGGARTAATRAIRRRGAGAHRPPCAAEDPPGDCDGPAGGSVRVSRSADARAPGLRAAAAAAW